MPRDPHHGLGLSQNSPLRDILACIRLKLPNTTPQNPGRVSSQPYLICLKRINSSHAARFQLDFPQKSWDGPAIGIASALRAYKNVDPPLAINRRSPSSFINSNIHSSFFINPDLIRSFIYQHALRLLCVAASAGYHYIGSAMSTPVRRASSRWFHPRLLRHQH